MKEKVSCVIPTYKRNDTLGRAINSVLKQTYNNLEVLVVDDNEMGSSYSVKVKEIINEFKDPRVRYITQKKHINGAEARNEGIRQSQGEYIAFLDDDDEWLPDKIEKQICFLNRNTDIGGVSCLYNEYMNGVLFHSCPPYTCENLHKKIFQREVSVFTSTILLRKEALLQTGCFDNTLRRHQDLQLLLDFTIKNKMAVLNEYLVKLHSDSNINRPSYKSFVTIKKVFFSAVASHFELYSRREQSQIKAAHHFELAFAACREHLWWEGLMHIVKVGINIPAYRHLIKRMKNRKYIVNA